jgi:hypothetical protein
MVIRPVAVTDSAAIWLNSAAMGSKILPAMVIKNVNWIVAVLESTNGYGYETKTESAKGYATAMKSSNGSATVTERVQKVFSFFFGEISDVDLLLDFHSFPLNHFRSTSSKSGCSGVQMTGSSEFFFPF